jgi:hypothetical protein
MAASIASCVSPEVPVMETPDRQRLGPTCSDYREEMMLLALRRRLQEETLDESARSRLLAEIGELERRLGMS